ncbi:MAG: hypothetical protein QN173_05935 [Armatimonadota bacterium]|nr:hypothetical protein [Armatimonadota bacterium]MDR7402819.1 hypothetical protein [Armatimonadota bacterium]MDR7403956.1 hypothetical protein [Armatimonadota bacterium]MDR7436157.1 hypothetical protein [Armatimonadota bacterium]MDR7472036.1 hypothetical protein [Armatimonadota bacterium]
MADTPVTVRIVLTDEDYRRLATFLRARGRSEADGFVWLVREGVRHYGADQEAWDASADGPRARELQWREARAHLLLMRTRAAELEARVAELREAVATLSPRYQKLRAALFALQRERQALTASSAVHPPAPAPRGLIARLREVLLRARPW